MASGKKKSKNDRRKKESGDARTPKPVEPEPAVADVVEPVVAETVTKVVAPSAEPAPRGALTEMVPVRFDPQMLSDVRRRAADDHRSVSSWIRRAVDQELQRGS